MLSAAKWSTGTRVFSGKLREFIPAVPRKGLSPLSERGSFLVLEDHLLFCGNGTLPEFGAHHVKFDCVSEQTLPIVQVKECFRRAYSCTDCCCIIRNFSFVRTVLRLFDQLLPGNHVCHVKTCSVISWCQRFIT